MNGYTIQRLQHGGVMYSPIVDPAGRILDRAALAVLAATACAAPDRVIDFVLLDESTPRPPSDLPPFHVVDVALCEDLPIELGDSGLAVGRVEFVEARPAGATVDTVGRHLVARARIYPTVLGDIAWRGITSGLLDGVCAVVIDEAEGPVEVLAVRLGPAEESCLASATVRSWAEGDRVPPPPEALILGATP